MGRETNKTTNNMFFCKYCHHGYKSEQLLNCHLIKRCMANEIQHIKLPKEGTPMMFEKHFKKLKAPFVIVW